MVGWWWCLFLHGPLHTSKEDQRERYSPEPPKRKLCVTVMCCADLSLISVSLFSLLSVC